MGSEEGRKTLAVKVMGMDVGSDGGRKQAAAGVPCVEAVAEFGGGDILVDSGQEVNTGTLRGRESEWGELGFGQRKFGTADDDPFGEFEQPIRCAPAAKVEEAVGAGEDEQGCGGVLEGEGGESVDGVVWTAVWAWGIEGGDGEPEILLLRGCGAREDCHFEAVGEGGGGALGF